MHPRETLQNLSYFWNTKTGSSLIFILICVVSLFFSRIIALTPAIFFVKWYNVVDFAVVLILVIVSVISVISIGEWTDKLALLGNFQ